MNRRMIDNMRIYEIIKCIFAYKVGKGTVSKVFLKSERLNWNGIECTLRKLLTLMSLIVLD